MNEAGLAERASACIGKILGFSGDLSSDFHWQSVKRKKPTGTRRGGDSRRYAFKQYTSPSAQNQKQFVPSRDFRQE